MAVYDTSVHSLQVCPPQYCIVRTQVSPGRISDLAAVTFLDIVYRILLNLYGSISSYFSDLIDEFDVKLGVMKRYVI